MHKKRPKGLAAIPRRRDIPVDWGRVFCHLSVISHVPILPIILGARYDTKGPPIWNPDNRKGKKIPIYAYAQDRPRLTNTRTLEEKLVCCPPHTPHLMLARCPHHHSDHTLLVRVCVCPSRGTSDDWPRLEFFALMPEINADRDRQGKGRGIRRVTKGPSVVDHN